MTVAPDPTTLPAQWATQDKPDPTDAVNRTVQTASKAERDYVDGLIAKLEERLHGIDKATEIRLGSIAEMPGLIDQKLAHLLALIEAKFASLDVQFTQSDAALQSLMEEKFASIAKQFVLNDTALVAALAAQKEAARTQDETNQKAIAKSEAATSEAIGKMGDLFRSTTDALADKIDDIKSTSVARQSALELQVQAINSNKAGGQERVTEHRQSSAAVFAAVGFGISLLMALIVVVGILINKTP